MLKIDNPDGTTTHAYVGLTNHEINDSVNNPMHYRSLGAKCSNCSAQIECIDVTRHMNFNLGNAVKYIWRADHKGNRIEDLKKSVWYIEDFIKNNY